MAYPGVALRRGRANNPSLVADVQTRLIALGGGPVDGIFGEHTESAVKLFQTRRAMRPADGIVGPVTWAELFAEQPPLAVDAPSELLTEVLRIARTQVGVRETPGRPNRGKEVDEYLRTAGLDPDSVAAPSRGYAWCCAGVYWTFVQAAKAAQVANPCPRTAWVPTVWKRAPEHCKVTAEAAQDDPGLIKPGALLVIDHGNDKSHIGIVRAVQGGVVLTTEFNTNKRGSREGDGVYEMERTLAEINVGYVLFS